MWKEQFIACHGILSETLRKTVKALRRDSLWIEI
jgi:hypothetical protein